MKKYIVEFIGTFFLVATVGFTVIGAQIAGKDPMLVAPLAIGAVLMVMVFAGGHISGGHYNPAVTLAVFLRGKCPASDVPGYMLAQCAAAVAAASIVILLQGNAADTAGFAVTAKVLDVKAALLAEFLFTFALCYVVLNVATSKGTQGNSFYGLAIGFTVFAGISAVGSISGGALNPAVAIGITVMGMLKSSDIWIYLVANLAAGAAAALVFKLVNPADA